MIPLLLGATLAFGATPRLVIDHPLRAAAPCAEPAPAAIVTALRDGVTLPWRKAQRLFPEVGLERVLVRRVVVRAANVTSCDGRIIGDDVTARIVGPRGMPIEAAVATRLRSGVVLAVAQEDVRVRPPIGSWRITTRDGWTAYGTWDLGTVRGGGPF